MASGNLWSDTELEILLRLTGRYPTRILTTQYNQQITEWNQANGTNYQHRTEWAIIAKIKRMQLSLEPSENYITVKELASLLNISIDRVANWIRKNKLYATKRSESRTSWYAISVEDLRYMAEAYPHLLYGCDRNGLSYFIGKMSCRKWEKAVNKTTGVTGLKVKIRDKKTGKIFNSATEAGKYYYLSRTHIVRLAKQNKSDLFELV